MDFSKYESQIRIRDLRMSIDRQTTQNYGLNMASIKGLDNDLQTHFQQMSNNHVNSGVFNLPKDFGASVSFRTRGRFQKAMGKLLIDPQEFTSHVDGIFKKRYVRSGRDKERSGPMVRTRFYFWENLKSENASGKSLLNDFGQFKVLSMKSQNWLAHRFDEMDYGFLMGQVRIIGEAEATRQLVLGLQGFPNSMFSIEWPLYSEDYSRKLQTLPLEVNFSSRYIEKQISEYLQNPYVLPCIALSAVKIGNYTRQFSSNFMKELKPKIESLLKIFKIASHCEDYQYDQNYFETNLKNQMLGLMVSYYAFRMIDFPSQTLIGFCGKFKSFYSEMNDLIRFLLSVQHSGKSFLRLCFAFKQLVSTDSKFHLWIKRWLTFTEPSSDLTNNEIL